MLAGFVLPGDQRSAFVYDGFARLCRAVVIETDSGVYPPWRADREFIAHAREDIPRLLAYVRELEQKLSPKPAEDVRLVHLSHPLLYRTMCGLDPRQAGADFEATWDRSEVSCPRCREG
ncbi:MAG TPA: hypothetical protein VD948_02890 [Rhodothermales bacterium]|nr:hypothetical protein [Rhodothermales bacterium]